MSLSCFIFLNSLRLVKFIAFDVSTADVSIFNDEYLITLSVSILFCCFRLDCLSFLKVLCRGIIMSSVYLMIILLSIICFTGSARRKFTPKRISVPMSSVTYTSMSIYLSFVIQSLSSDLMCVSLKSTPS